GRVRRRRRSGARGASGERGGWQLRCGSLRRLPYWPAQAAAVCWNTCLRLYPDLKLVFMVATVAMSAELFGARKHTAWNTFCTCHWANQSLAASSWPSDLAPTPLPGSDGSKPRNTFGPARQRFDQVLSGVTKPYGKLVALIRYFGCT